MNREQAERERDRLAAEHPDATFIATQGDDGWQILNVGIASASGATGTAIAAKPKPPEPDDPRSASSRNLGAAYGGG